MSISVVRASQYMVWPYGMALAKAAKPHAVRSLRLTMTEQRSFSFRARAIHNSGYAREDKDFYATPDWVTEALLQHFRPRGAIWEPCCGTGAISEVLIEQGHTVVSTDIADRGYGKAGVDIFACRAMPQDCRCLITNPPYGETGVHRDQDKSPAAMLDFVSHTLMLAGSVRGQLALLVRFQWIAGKRAAHLMSLAPFSAVIALRRRIRWFDMGKDTKQGQHHHAWVIFDWEHEPGRPPALLFAG
jgi:hypothetical protein